MSLGGAVIAVVAAADAACERVAAPLRGAGATVTGTIVEASALATLSAPGFDAAVLDVGDEPERYEALGHALRNEPRTRGLPLLALAAPGLAAERLSGLGPVHVGSQVDEAHLVRSLSEIVDQRRAVVAAAEHVRALEERLRIAHDRLAVLRAEAQTLTHDARVLCGVVVGFAANLRDGIAGPLDALQRGHVAQILEAANDTSALVERFGGAARAHTELPTEPVNGAGAQRTARRTLLDFVELTRATLALFAKVAEQKGIAVTCEAPEPVSLWGDAMQIKQVVTNLLVNALKFTPAGGRVMIGVRSIAPPGTQGGLAARQQAELIVCDTGPGIPPAEREHVFERGVRLSRDERVPGTGIGLSVVREIVAAHGGTARAEEAPGGGAALVVRLPIDMRSRRESAILLVDDPAAARRVVEVVKQRRDWSRESIRAGDGSLAALLEALRAVVVVPRAPRGVLDEILPGMSTGSSRPPRGGAP